MARKKRKGTCGLCGSHLEITREHFVPQGLWPGALPVRTETIPACTACNADTNLDDEYFRNTIVTMFDCEHPQKRRAFEGPVLRSLKQHPGWINHLVEKSKVHP